MIKLSTDLKLDDMFMYQVEKLKIIDDIEKSFEDPDMQRKYKIWLKKRLKTESREDCSKSNIFTLIE